MRSAPIGLLGILLGLSPTAAASTWGMPEVINDRLALKTDLYIQMLFLGALVFIVVFGWMALNLLKFRPGGDGKASDEEHRGSIKAELVWTIIPLLIVAWIGFVSAEGLFELEEMGDNPATIEIEANAYQWFWEFDYGDDVVMRQSPGAGGSLEGEEPFLIPAGEPVTVNVTGQDVQHAFKITNLGVMVDAIPFSDNFITFTAPEGEYLIQCAEMCGNPGHAYMNAWVHAVPPGEFVEWLDEKRAEVREVEAQHTVDIVLTEDGFDQDEYLGVGQVDNVFNVTNEGDEERSFAIEDTNLTGDVPAGETVLFNTTLEAGAYTMTSNDDTATLNVEEPEVVTVELDEWEVRSDVTTFEVGQPYVLEVLNPGVSLHNLWIGEPTPAGEAETLLWASEDLRSGESDTMLIIPQEEHVGTWEWWCEISGHYAQGMFDTITIVE